MHILYIIKYKDLGYNPGSPTNYMSWVVTLSFYISGVQFS